MSIKRDNFDPKFWGQIYWKTMFITALNYPTQTPPLKLQHQYRDFFLSLQGVIPCQKCRQGVRLFLYNNPIVPALKSQTTLIKWVVKMYNEKRPPNLKIKDLAQLKQQINGDPTINDTVDRMKKNNPKLKFI